MEVVLAFEQFGLGVDFVEEIFVFGERTIEAGFGLEEIRVGQLDFAGSAAWFGPVSGFDNAEAIGGDMESDGTKDLAEAAIGADLDFASGEGEGLNTGWRFAGDLGAIGVHIMVEIGTVVAIRVSTSGADVIAVGIAEHFDESVFEIGFAFDDVLLEIGDGIGLASEELAGVIGVIEDRDGVIEGADGAIVDLFEMRAILRNENGIEIEGDDIFSQAERVKTGVGFIDLILDIDESGGDIAKFGDGGAIDLLDAGVGGLWIESGEEGVAGGPVEESGLAGAGAPFRKAPSAVGIRIAVALPLSIGIFDVSSAVGEIDDFGAGLGACGGGFGELAFVEVID